MEAVRYRLLRGLLISILNGLTVRNSACVVGVERKPRYCTHASKRAHLSKDVNRNELLRRTQARQRSNTWISKNWCRTWGKNETGLAGRSLPYWDRLERPCLAAAAGRSESAGLRGPPRKSASAEA